MKISKHGGWAEVHSRNAENEKDNIKRVTAELYFDSKTPSLCRQKGLSVFNLSPVSKTEPKVDIQLPQYHGTLLRDPLSSASQESQGNLEVWITGD